MLDADDQTLLQKRRQDEARLESSCGWSDALDVEALEGLHRIFLKRRCLKVLLPNDDETDCGLNRGISMLLRERLNGLHDDG